MEKKLEDALVAAEALLNSEYGTLTLNGKDLTDKNGKSLYHQYGVVDRIHKEYGYEATIFAKDGSDYRRITTSITDDSGSRIIDTVLDQKSPAYPCIQSGSDYSGEAVIHGKNYLTEYKPIFAAGTKDVIGILFVGILK